MNLVDVSFGDSGAYNHEMRREVRSDSARTVAAAAMSVDDAEGVRPVGMDALRAFGFSRNARS